MFAGVTTILMKPENMDTALGFLYNSKLFLVAIGLIFFVSGFFLFFGKVTKNRRMVGWGLWMTFQCFLFAGALQLITFGFTPVVEYLGNFIAAAIIGLLYLRWKFKFFYELRGLNDK